MAERERSGGRGSRQAAVAVGREEKRDERAARHTRLSARGQYEESAKARVALAAAFHADTIEASKLASKQAN